jgi:hypothetical protein
MITNSQVRRAMAWAHRAEVCDDIRQILSPDGRGAPSPLTVEAFLAGCLLTLQMNRPLTISNITRVLTQNTSIDMQRSLGTRYSVPRESGSIERVITRRPVENMLKQLGIRLSSLPSSAPDIPAEERLRREELLQSLMDRLIDASKPLDLAPTGHYALDATGVWEWGRAPGKNHPKPMDARWGHKTAKSGEEEIFFGFDVYAWVRIQEVGAQDPYPHLVERLVVRPAASDEPDSTLPMIRRMLAGAYSIRTLIIDRAWSFKEPERWAAKLRELAIEQVVDLHKYDHGVRDYQGLRVVAGWPHCPGMPDELIDIRRPVKLTLPDGTTVDDLPETTGDAVESKAQRETREFINRIQQRRTFATRRVAGPNRHGDERHECPADAGQLRCPLKALSMHLPADFPRVTSPPAKEVAPPICRQRTVTVPGTVTPKVRQRAYWGSVEWIRSFARRTHVEGAFGNIKNRNTENITRGWVQVTGHARHSLLLAIAAAAYNLRVARKWQADTGVSEDPLLQEDPPFLGWQEVTQGEDGSSAT